MKAGRHIQCLIIGISLLSSVAAFAGSGNFTGSFSGFYAPANWVTVKSGNPAYQNSASVSTAGAPTTVVISGAVGPNTATTTPFSVINYSTTVQGGSVGESESISFSYTFFDPAVIAHDAEVLDNGVFVADLPASGSQFNMPTGFVAGDTLEIQVTSGNLTAPDVLTIAPVPEPSTMALAGIGGIILLWQSRRNKFSRN